MPINLSRPPQLKQRPSSDLSALGSARDLQSAVLHLQRQVDYLFSQVGSPPSIDYFSVEAAEIGTLYVGNIDGAGQVEIYSGPPSYDLIGWFGTRDSGQTVTVTSIVGGTVALAGTHNLRVGNVVLISGTDNADHNDYWAVLSIVDDSTFTISATGNSTGGEMTKQFRGGWVQEFAHGGSGPDEAPVWSNYLGQTYFGGEASIILLGPQEQEIGFFGTDYSNDSFAVTGATNATPIVVTTDLPHNMVEGDTCFIFNSGGNTAANGLFIARNPTSTTLELYDLNNNPVAGNGAYAGGATLIPYDSGILVQTVAIGQSFDDYKLRAFADGSLRIQNAIINLVGPDATIEINPDPGYIQITGDNYVTTLEEGYLTSYPIGELRRAIFHADLIALQNGSSIIGMDRTNGVFSTEGYRVGLFPVITSSRVGIFASVEINGTPVIDSSRNATFNNLSVLGSFDAGGADAAGVLTIGGLSVSTATINYLDHAAAPQSMLVVTAVSPTNSHLWSIDGGIISSFA